MEINDTAIPHMNLLKKALTFDDLLLVPSYSNVLPQNVVLHTQLTLQIKLNIPILSAAMDTVTESRLAITLAQEGGLGIIHKNLKPEIQAKEVAKVKRFESGILRDPITVHAKQNIADVLKLADQYGVSGFPVVDGKELVGVITNRDLRFIEDLHAEVGTKMTPRDKLITLKEDEANLLETAKKLMHQHRLERVLLVDAGFQLTGLITVKDIQKATEHPNACRDDQGRLRVGAAVGVGANNQQRIELLIQAGADVLVVDTAHGHSQAVLDQVKWIKTHYPNMQVIAGNIATADAALALEAVGADAVKVGIGPGSICTTRIVAGVGVPQISAIDDVYQALQGRIPIIADGGIRYSGDAAKALAVGANVVMLGGMLAGTEESPGEVFLYQGRSYKSYRGMGSVGAMKEGSADRYFQDAKQQADKLVPEGIEGRVAYKGSALQIIRQLIGGIRSSMGYCGCENIHIWHQNAKFVEITSAGMRESHVHDVQITKEAPNYHISD
jgi:IMP dehydrogenase